MLITKDIIFRSQTLFLTNDALDSDRINAFNYWCQWDLLHNMPESSEWGIRVVLEHVDAFDLWLWGVRWDIYTFALADAFVLILSEVIIYHASSLMSTHPCAGLL